MHKLTAATVSVAAAVMATAIGFAGPAAADDTVWVMPGVKGEVLQNAIDDVISVTGPGVNIGTYDVNSSQHQLNMTNWIVCGSSPKAGSAISQKSKKVTLAVARPNVGC